MSPRWTIHNNRTLTTYDGLSSEQAVKILRNEAAEELANWYAWSEGMVEWAPVKNVKELDLADSRLKPPPVKPKPSVKPVLNAVDETKESKKPVTVVAEPEEFKPIPFRQDDDGQIAFDFGDLDNKRSVPAAEIYWMDQSHGNELVKADIDDLAYMKKASAPSESKKVETAAAPSPAAPAQSTDYRDRRKYERYNVRLAVIIQSENLMFRTYTKNISLGGIALEAPVPSTFFGSDCQMIVTEPNSGEKAQFIGRILTHRDTARYISFFRASPDNIVKMQGWITKYLQQNKKSA